MGANPTQAMGVSAFLLGFTAIAGGLYGGKIILYVLGIALLAASVAVFLKAKPLEDLEN
jgi:hypothetical protein